MFEEDDSPNGTTLLNCNCKLLSGMAILDTFLWYVCFMSIIVGLEAHPVSTLDTAAVFCLGGH